LYQDQELGLSWSCGMGERSGIQYLN